MPDAIQILTSLEYLGPYASGTYFGLVIQVGVGEVANAVQAVQATSAMIELFEPWKWKSPVAGSWWPQIQLWKYAKGGDPAAATNSTDDPVPFDIRHYDCPAVRSELESDCADAIKNNHLLWTDPGQVAGSTTAAKLGYPWPAELAQVARLPYPIPHVLRLSYFLKTKDPGFAKPDPTSAYFATVTFQAKVNGATRIFKAQASTASFLKAPNGQVRITVPYDDPNIFMITQPVTNSAPAAFVVKHGSLTPEIRDWQAHLVEGCADLFDIPERLLGVVRGDCQGATSPASCAALQTAVAAEFNAYSIAFLTAQRNLLSYGALIGPDGSSVLKRVSNEWVRQGGDISFAKSFQAAVQKQLNEDATSADPPSVHDSWLLLLRNTTALANNPVVGPSPTASGGVYKKGNTYKTGETVLYHGQLFRARSDGQLDEPSLGDAQWNRLTPEISVDASHLAGRLTVLEHLQQRLAQNEVLSTLLVAQWDRIQNGDAKMYQLFRDSVLLTVADLNLRGLLLQGNLHDSWAPIIAGSSRDTLRKNIPDELTRRMKTLLVTLPGVAGTPAFAASLMSIVQDWTKKNVIDYLVPLALVTPGSKPKTSVAPQPTRTSEGLSILFGTMDAATAPDQDGVDDLRDMTGFCVLMRTQKENIWRCLNVGVPVRMNGNSAIAAVTGLSTPVVIAVPQHTQDGLRRATLTYNNQPLMSESPAHAFSKGIVPEQNPIRPRLVSFRHPSADKSLEDSGLSQWKIPGLDFNEDYDFLIGRMSNSGALPASFADAKLGPGVLNFASIPAGAAASVAGIPYRRTVPVSSLRFGPNGSDLEKVNLPPIPRDVQPRARDANSLPVSPRDESTPLVLLSSYGTLTDKFVLNIAKPTTDLLTWDRWMAALDSSLAGTNSDIRKLRAQVWERYHRLARQENSRFKTSLDDPAVRHLTITIEGVEGLSAPDATATSSWAAPPMSPDPAPPDNAVLHLANAIVLTIKVSDVVPAKIFDPATWTLTVKPGTVAKISLKPSIESGDQKYFASCIDAANLKSYSFLLETANKEMPSSDTLWRGLTITPPDGLTRSAVDFLLQLNSQPNVGRVDLQTQLWRWDGRPNSPYRFTQPTNPPTKALLEWELEAFSSRIESDATFRPMARTRPSANTPPDTIAFEAHDDRSADPGATFYRAAVIAHNRYGSLVPAEAQSVSSITDFASIPGADGGWKRCFVPSTLASTYKVPKPGIKFIVPLTGTTDQSEAHAASILVIVQGPWYALGGLAEEMRAYIAKASSLDFNSDFQEVGPDPILFSGQRSELPKEYQDYENNPTLLHGPVGHTFDQSDVNPLWVYSSFVLDAPVPKVGAGSSKAQEGTFAAVQFKRVIRRGGLVNPPPKGGDLESEKTDPVWVQFLPSRFVPFTTPVAGLQLQIDANGNAEIVRDSKVITLSHGLNSDKKAEHLLFGLLVTEEVPDLLGRKSQERFVDVLLQPAQPDVTLACWKAGLQQGASYTGRILVIQRQASTTSFAGNISLANVEQLWDEMFPAKDNQSGRDTLDAVSRIVAVSPPISTALQESCVDDTGGQR